MVDNSVSLNSYIKAVDPLIQVMRQCNHFYGHFALLCWKGMDWMPIIVRTCLQSSPLTGDWAERFFGSRLLRTHFNPWNLGRVALTFPCCQALRPSGPQLAMIIKPRRFQYTPLPFWYIYYWQAVFLSCQFISASLQHYWDFSRRFISWLIHISYQTTGIFLSIGRLSVAYFLITARSYRLCCPLINLTHSDNTNSPYHVKRFPDLSISTVVIWFQSFRIAECCFSWCCMVSS